MLVLVSACWPSRQHKIREALSVHFVLCWIDCYSAVTAVNGACVLQVIKIDDLKKSVDRPTGYENILGTSSVVSFW